jgi:AcrR family transcriptional regulator
MQIAEAAGVTAANLYHYHPSKADLFAAVGRDSAAAIESALKGAFESTSTLRARLGALADSFASVVDQNPGLVKFLVVWWQETSRQPELADLCRQAQATALRYFERLVDDAVVRGEVPEDTDPVGLANAVLATLLGLAVLSSWPDGPGDVRPEPNAGATPRMFRGAGTALAALFTGTYFPAPRRAR